MSFNNSFTAVTGVTYTAAQYNTYTRDNLTATWVGTTAGDMEYYTGAAAKQRLALGDPYELMRVNAGATAPEWGQAPFVVKTHYDGTGHTYNSTTERNMPNSSASITPLVQSTVVVWANVIAANASGNCWFQYLPRIESTNGAMLSSNLYGATTRTVPAIAVFSGITVGAKTVLLREKEGYGAGLSYTVSGLNWVALAIPEQ